MKRPVSIYVDGMPHSNPVPNAAVVGNILVSGAIFGRHPVTREVGDMHEQARQMFRNVETVLKAAGGGFNNIVKMNVELATGSTRDGLNAAWLETFPDEMARPARHVGFADMRNGSLIRCDIIAVL